MQRKTIILFLFLILFSLMAPMSVMADTANDEEKPKPFSTILKEDNGIRPIEPIDIDAVGEKTLEMGDKIYNFLLKARALISVLGIGGSILLLLLGIFFGKKLVAAGVTGIFITIIVFVLIQYMPEILVTVKSAIDSLLV